MLFKWTQEVEGLISNPASKIKGPKISKRLPVFVKQEQMELETIKTPFTDDFQVNAIV